MDGEGSLKAFQKNKSKNLKRKLNPDKAKPSVRRGRKAAGLAEDGRAAEGSTLNPLVGSVFLLYELASLRSLKTKSTARGGKKGGQNEHRN